MVLPYSPSRLYEREFKPLVPLYETTGTLMEFTTLDGEPFLDLPVRKRILITGAAGFFGHHLVEHVLRNTDWEIIALVRLGRIGNLRRMTDLECWPAENIRVTTVWHDLRSPLPDFVRNMIGPVDYIVHAAASTHVDQSIADPGGFVQDNVVGTLNLLQYARDLPHLQWFHYFSTDEVYGTAAEGTDFSETDRYNATNPYSACKAGAEQLVNAFGNTYGLPVFTTNTMNLIGERASHEKFLNLVMRKVLAGEMVTIHADPSRTKPGKRHYLHCRNAAAATLFLLKHAEQRDRYNVVGDVELDNLEFAERIAAIMGYPLNYELVSWHASRPGHDLRYSLSGEKLKQMGFTFPVSFESSLKKTVLWMLNHPEWLEAPE